PARADERRRAPREREHARARPRPRLRAASASGRWGARADQPETLVPGRSRCGKKIGSARLARDDISGDAWCFSATQRYGGGNRMRRWVIPGLLAPVLFGSGHATAHHSFAAEFDAEKPISLEGVVTKVEWTNPHVWIYFNVRDAETGQVTNWGAE